MSRLRTALRAARDFARGFLGLPTRREADAAAARRRLRDTAERPHCC